ncbi:MAG TPA: toll/interleukin-1 receptor domain-containing protein, partial [Candidatus Tectomicrobia bacterium]
MTRVFLSYARNDLQVVQRLEQEIVAHGLTVWRDQDSIYGGQQWPKAIGEAIATHDRVVLVWSQHAARSHFVELEWNIALALQTSIIPCWLDQTPLPPALSSTNGIDLRVLLEALPRLLKALHQSAAPPEAMRQASVV